MAGVGVFENICYRPRRGSAGRSRRDVGVFCADNDENGAGRRGGFDASAGGSQDGTGLISPLRMGPEDGCLVAVWHGVSRVLQRSIRPADDVGNGIRLSLCGIDTRWRHAVDENDCVGLYAFSHLERENSAEACPNEKNLSMLFRNPRNDLIDVVRELRLLQTALGRNEVGSDDLPTGPFKHGFPKSVFPAASSRAVDHDGDVRIGGGD